MFEELLKSINRLIAAVEANTAAHGGATPVAAPAAEKPKTRAAKAVEAAQAAPAPAPAAAPAVAGLTHKDLVPLVTELMNADYARCANIIEVAAGNVKGAKFPTVPVEKLQGVKEEIEAALAKIKATPAAPPSLI